MATSKTLQKPVILGIKGSTIRVAHPDISRYPGTALAAQISASGTSMTVHDNQYPRWDDNDWLLVGEIGDNRTETCDINDGAMSRGTGVTVTNNLDFDHELDSPVRKILERGIKIYGAASDGGSGTIIESVDALAASGKQLADAVMVNWNQLYTEYTFITTDTAYSYYYVVFTDGTTDSSASDYIPSTGWTNDRVIRMVEESLHETDTQLDATHITLDMCVRWADEAQKAITQYKYQDPRTGVLTHIDWDFEVTEDTTLTASTNEIEYALSGMTATPKYSNSDRAIIGVRLGDKKPLGKQTENEFDEDMVGKPKTEVATQANANDTSLVVDSNVEFDTSGTLYVGSDTITYTGKTGTDTFTGIPASGTGSITTTHAVDAPVWQGIEPDLPTDYHIFEGNIVFNKPVDSDYNNYPIKVRMYKQLTALSEASDQTSVSFYNVFHSFISSRIERRKGNEEKAAFYMQEFEKQVLNNALANSVPTLDQSNYYEFVQDDNLGSVPNINTNA